MKYFLPILIFITAISTQAQRSRTVTVNTGDRVISATCTIWSTRTDCHTSSRILLRIPIDLVLFKQSEMAWNTVGKNTAKTCSKMPDAELITHANTKAVFCQQGEWWAKNRERLFHYAYMRNLPVMLTDDERFEIEKDMDALLGVRVPKLLAETKERCAEYYAAYKIRPRECKEL